MEEINSNAANDITKINEKAYEEDNNSVSQCKHSPSKLKTQYKTMTKKINVRQR